MAKVLSSEHRRNIYANIRYSTHSTWMNHSIWYPLSPAFLETNENFEPFVSITSARLPAKKKMENLVAFYGWYNSIPLLFLIPKKLPFEFDGKFSPRSPYFRMRSSQPLFFLLTNWVKIMFEQFLNFRIL